MPCPHLDLLLHPGPRSPLTGQGAHPWHGVSLTPAQARKQGAARPLPTTRAWAARHPQESREAQHTHTCTHSTRAHNTARGCAHSTHRTARVCKHGYIRVCTRSAQCTYNCAQMAHACAHTHAGTPTLTHQPQHRWGPQLRAPSQERAVFPKLSRGHASPWERAAPQGTPPDTPSRTAAVALVTPPAQGRGAGSPPPGAPVTSTGSCLAAA